MNTAHLTDAEYKLFERLISSGQRVNPTQIRTCPHCVKPYKVATGVGSSKNHCADEPCRLAARAEQVRIDNAEKQDRYRAKIHAKEWKHDKQKEAYRQKAILNTAAGFSYV